MTTLENNEKQKIARSLLKHSSIKIKKVNGRMTFVLPEALAKKITEVYNFSLEQLRVGGDIPLHDLAVHMDEHATLEASAGMAAEEARLLKEIEQLSFDCWYETKSNEVREWWNKKYGKWPTDKQTIGRMMVVNGEQYNEKKKSLIELESSYRILHNVIKSAVIVKGDMLRSMRPILQGNGQIISGIDVQVAKAIRKELGVISFKTKQKEK
jgi:hypothetical protein